MRNATATIAVILSTMVTSAFALAISSSFFPASTRQVRIEHGHEVFATHCAGCHSLGSEHHRFGPSLANIGSLAVTRREGMSAEAYILQSIVDPSAYRVPGVNGEMPVDISLAFTNGDLLDVTAMLASQKGGVDYAELLRAEDSVVRAAGDSVVSLDLASIERGKLLYHGKHGCVVCHPLRGGPGNTLLAPNLELIGQHDREYLKKSILDPTKHVVATYETWTVVHEGTPVSGRRLPSEESEVRLLSRGEEGKLQLHIFQRPAEDDEDFVVTQSSTSPMPSYKEAMTDNELDSVLSYLQTFR